MPGKKQIGLPLGVRVPEHPGDQAQGFAHRWRDQLEEYVSRHQTVDSNSEQKRAEDPLQGISIALPILREGGLISSATSRSVRLLLKGIKKNARAHVSRMGRSRASLGGGLDIVEGLLEWLAMQIVGRHVDLTGQVLDEVRGGELRRIAVRT